MSEHRIAYLDPDGAEVSLVVPWPEGADIMPPPSIVFYRVGLPAEPIVCSYEGYRS